MTTSVTFLKRIMHALIDTRERNAQKRTHEYLLGLSDRSLNDMGFSRELLEQGLKAWPWRTPDESLVALSLPAETQELKTDNDALPAGHDRGRRSIEQTFGFNPPATDTKLAA